jgi:hypothetical protein
MLYYDVVNHITIKITKFFVVMDSQKLLLLAYSTKTPQELLRGLSH